jgi:hypothetical protein
MENSLFIGAYDEFYASTYVSSVYVNDVACHHRLVEGQLFF